ncbi:hypothetical protein PspLS_08057 [Pyricularia sp. CBS 133598]|nr:hypothetical protein PspLS_08057 [Pyricularia sp. CBS 133598]
MTPVRYRLGIRSLPWLSSMVELVLWVVSVSWFLRRQGPPPLASAGSRAFDGLSGTNRKDTRRKVFFEEIFCWLNLVQYVNRS